VPIAESGAAVTDLDRIAPEADRTAIQPEPVALQPEVPQADPHQEEPPRTPEQHESAADAERTARRRSTVREKVSFVLEAQPAPAPAAVPLGSEGEPAAAAPEPQQPSQQAEANTPPRRAGWWSRRFGGGE
jgi:ribonuclease E